MSRTTLIAACAVAAAAGVAAPIAVATQPDPARPASVVATQLPHPPSPQVDAVTAALPALHPARGAVARAAGPFDERFTLTGLRLSRGAVDGLLTVTSDVSEIIELDVLVGFYDAAGHYLGSGTYVKHGEDMSDVDERVRLHVQAPPRLAARVASAAVGVPMLVNE